MNAQWQQVHQNVTAESESLRQRALENHQLQSEVNHLRQYQQAYAELERRLSTSEQLLAERNLDAENVHALRSGDAATIQRLQTELESLQENGESQAGQLEAELLERSRELVRLRREKEDQQRKMEELLQRQLDSNQAAEECSTLRSENEALRQRTDTAEQEKQTLSGVVERCLGKLEKDGRERPHLVDKRMVTQMLAAYLEQRDNPVNQQEIMVKMADLLGFTTAEREQVGLSQRRKTLGELQEPAGLLDLSDRFVDFLMEESEAG